MVGNEIQILVQYHYTGGNVGKFIAYIVFMATIADGYAPA